MIGVPVTTLAEAAISDFRFWFVVIISVIAAITIPSPLGGIAAVAIAAVYRNRLWWRLHNERRDTMLAEITASGRATRGSSRPD
ncbi:MAG: hypothetical protein JO246_10635 [Frankiaceae bacterium]|nr:hypothetical protein [Frankiaceae bacterium]MBV9870619.1 hypothetical protein [Frankiaceae bacterium]